MMPNFSLRSSGPAIRAATTGIVEFTTTTGTGAYQLRGPAPGFETLISRVPNGWFVRYRTTDGVTQEIGIGLFNAVANELTRARSILPVALVDWSVGRKLIYIMQISNSQPV